ncbi:MAG: insulinase family protein [Bacteroidales bacterium]|nr:insulinase family protein [Bacteroidales bacterium]
MRRINLQRILLFFMFLLFILVSKAQDYKYESIAGDPLKARIYTLSNGLKVYLSVYKEEPRIQTFIAVRVGSKNDPKQTTGLAHYFEHMMFKGTPNFGSLDWSQEKPLIQKIDSLFEIYRVQTDPDKRNAIYHIIDSISYKASKFAIPNEYDKLMSAIGSQGSNAGTSNDYTVFMENIPSNELENWAIIEADRFSQPVLRIFHTELETVYEEKNMSLTNDGRKAGEMMMKGLFPNHPYGQQTTLGEAEHLKNPSMKNIREFYEKYYVPNNMAVVMSGDFDPDVAIKVIDKYFSKLKPSDVPTLKFEPEEPITSPKEFEVVGLEAENINIAYRFPGANSSEVIMVDMLAAILSNGKAGLIDLNINKKQLTLGSRASNQKLTDYSMLNLSGRNKSGQTLEEVKKLILDQIELLKNGQFPDWMLEAAINNIKLREMSMYESNGGRARAMYNSYLNKIEWKDAISYISKLEKITKDQLVAFAKQNLNNNYVVVYKRKGKPEDVAKVQKPAITPIFINRDSESDFLKGIKANKVTPVEPVFIDYTKDIQKKSITKEIEILSKENVENKIFNLAYYFPFGSNSDPSLNLATQYLQLLGTSKKSADEIGQEFYKLACTFNIYVDKDETIILVSGLSDNTEKAISLMENLLNDCKPDKAVLDSYIANVLKARNDSKLTQRSVFEGLVSYATFGPNSSFTNILTDEQLKNLKPEDLTNKIKDLSKYIHKIVYYGPLKPGSLNKILSQYHKLPKTFNPNPLEKKFSELETTSNRIVFAHYEAKQSYLQTVSRSIPYNQELVPITEMYNNYFGGGMNTIVFQELREKRGLAYSARSTFSIPDAPDKPFMNTSFIATQNDKIVDAFNAFNELFNQMPESDNAFNLAKESLITDIRTERVTKMNLLWNYIDALKMGRKTDIRKDLYSKIPTFTFADIKKFQEQYIKGKPKTYVILGKESDLDFVKLEQLYGPVTKLKLEDIFGF